MKRVVIAVAGLLVVAGSVLAQSQSADTSKLSEDLIYSVNRTPEHTFDTARAVEVITVDDLWRKSGLTLADVLVDEAGFIKYRTNQYSSAGLLRGLIGKQMLILIDGVKVNNALYGDTPNMDLIDLSQVERIEIVRGVVSVLGTESLGGAINIITRKGPPGQTTFGGTLTTRFSSATNSVSTPVQVYGQTDKLRYNASVNYLRAGELEGGKGVGVQHFTDFNQKAGNVNLQYLVSADKTLTFAYHGSQIDDAKSFGNMSTNTSLSNVQAPNRFQLSSLSYQDLTSRRWSDSLQVTAYWNQQDTGSDDIRVKTPTLETQVRDRDRMLGLNLEMGSFLGKSHHLVYGVDYAQDSIDSLTRDVNLSTDAVSYRRGRYTDDAKYSSLGVYVQDHFSVSKWLTASAGIRYGSFKTQGSETLPLVGAVSLDSTKSDATTSVNMIVHVTPTLNVIGNVMHGFRAPNLQDISRFSQSATAIEIPATGAEAEQVTSYEAGVKYENRFVSGSAFYFTNDLSNLLIVSESTLNGLSFVDANNNGVKDANEPVVRENLNIGSAQIKGWEANVRIRPADWMQVWANMTHSTASTDDVLQAALVQRVPPPFGSAGLRFTANHTAHLPWAELVGTFTDSYEVDGTVLSPSFTEFKVRAGASITDRFRVLAGVENITDQKYLSRFSTVYWPGRRFVLSTEFKF
jgi:outer membrane receptor protein involved in Fe transport